MIDRAPKFGVPTSVNQACPRRLDEMPAQDAAAQEPVAQQHSAEQVAKEAAREDSVMRQENMTLDYVGGPKRRLQEMGSAAPEFVAQQNSAEQVAKEAAHEDSVVRQENMTLDYVGLATLSSEAQGCQCSSGGLRECGSKCLTKSGDARVDCITACLRAKNHPHACSECYGRRSECTLSNCLGKCALRPDSKGCTDCVHAKCVGDCR